MELTSVLSFCDYSQISLNYRRLVHVFRSSWDLCCAMRLSEPVLWWVNMLCVMFLRSCLRRVLVSVLLTLVGTDSFMIISCLSSSTFSSSLRVIFFSSSSYISYDFFMKFIQLLVFYSSSRISMMSMRCFSTSSMTLWRGNCFLSERGDMGQRLSLFSAIFLRDSARLLMLVGRFITVR